MVVTLPDWQIVALNVVAWFTWSVGVGYVGHRLPLERFTSDDWLTRARRYERGGAWYRDRLRIKRWKDRLPEAGDFFAGGFSKRSVRRGELERYVVETRRAEWVHWVGASLWPVFAIWNPPWAMVVIVAYALVANLPCIAVLRYNRLRIQRRRR